MKTRFILCFFFAPIIMWATPSPTESVGFIGHQIGSGSIPSIQCLSGCSTIELSSSRPGVLRFNRDGKANEVHLSISFRSTQQDQLFSLAVNSMVSSYGSGRYNIGASIRAHGGDLMTYRSTNSTWSDNEFNRSGEWEDITLNTGELVFFVEAGVETVELKITDLESVMSAELGISSLYPVLEIDNPTEDAHCPGSLFILVDQSGSVMDKFRNFQENRLRQLLQEIEVYNQVTPLPKIKLVFFSDRVSSIVEFKPGVDNIEGIVETAFERDDGRDVLTNFKAALDVVDLSKTPMVYILSDGMPNTTDGVTKRSLKSVDHFFQKINSIYKGGGKVSMAPTGNSASGTHQKMMRFSEQVVQSEALLAPDFAPSNERWARPDIAKTFAGCIEVKDDAPIEYNVYPNPSTGIFGLKVVYSEEVPEPVGFLHSANGKLMKKVNVRLNEVNFIDLSRMADGLYYLTLNLEDQPIRLPLNKINNP